MISKILLKIFMILIENRLYMLSFEKLVRDEQETIRPILNEDDDK